MAKIIESSQPTPHHQLLIKSGPAELAFVWMTAIFVTSLVLANFMGAALFAIEMPGIDQNKILVSAGIIAFPVTFILTDLLNEFYGKPGARLVTLIGFMMSILVYGALAMGEHLTIDSVSQLSQEEFHKFSQLYTGMFSASLVAYTCSQILDIQVFHIFRSWTKHKFIWLRATGSTVISQLFDSVVFTFIAFWGHQSIETLMAIALGNYVVKLVVVIAITPLLYIGHSFLNQWLSPQEKAIQEEFPEYIDIKEKPETQGSIEFETSRLYKSQLLASMGSEE
ncbi:MAG: queuosine precursor transporter [Cyanobacteria bacterium]|nr:queuosine precursor transporter [Cyanobacteriota bacterium]